MITYYSELDKKYRIINDSAAISIVNNVLSSSYSRLGEIDKAKYYQLISIEYLNDKQEDYNLNSTARMFGKAGKVNRYAVLGSDYISVNMPDKAEPYLIKAIQLYQQLDSPLLMPDAPFLYLQMASCKTLQNARNSSAYYDTALKYFQLYKSSPLEYAHLYIQKGADFISKNKFDSALIYIQKSRTLKDSLKLGVTSYMGELQPDYYQAIIALKKGYAKEAIGYLQNEIAEIRPLSLRSLLVADLKLLASAYSAAGNSEEAYKSLSEAFTIKEKLVADENESRSLNFETEKKFQENETTIKLLDEQNKNSKKIKYYLIGIVSLLLLLAAALGFSYSNKQKNNRRLSLKNNKLEQTLDQLKETQTQLIQSEKMASLGELTAGIAHEIQNPLNFVNNFSEVSKELLDEMKTELNNGNTEDAKEIADDVIQNLEKINHHGKRADAIVKGMLQHSQSTTGKKEPTDINALCDEYLHLSYHGLRAKDNGFNATLKTDFDTSLEKINIIPQEIGRVILNLINNAFYAVNEKNKLNIPGYEPTVTVSTSHSPSFGDGRGKAIIKVSDNGNGIPQKVLDKIFQPFFTTKPTGQGTGLGLSLSYDIIAKGHGGELKVETKEGEGSTFIIQLPVV